MRILTRKNSRKFLSSNDLALLMGMSYRTVWNRLDKGATKAHHVGLSKHSGG
jgi:hypothetical protein